MENNSFSFLSFQQDDEFSTSFPDFTILDVGMNHISFGSPLQNVEGIDLGDDKKGKMPKKLEETQSGSANQEVQKKIMHREIERQRRQEMATLYNSLRSVLPPHFLKGKRSTSDQIHEATKYIRCLKNNIKELGIKRDNLKRLSKNDQLVLDSEKGSCSKNLPNIVVTVQPCSIGVEVLISGDFIEEGLTLPLSRILRLLLEEGLVVVCCNLTKFDGKLHYAIQSEVLDYPGVDLQMLQRKLNGMISLIDIKQ
ncbi:hypothetical protein DH2020_040327 [Rehmannia glutinosa]|uniref:BHLH domain-containing protein n=1 Tax=Rehmannia glutinosa TaxID=99300 RepID=A0ABR0UU20_REHGL